VSRGEPGVPKQPLDLVLPGDPGPAVGLDRRVGGLALRQLDVTAEVSLVSAVPVGYGFGASGAATLATVLAANETVDLGKTREELLEIAHRAEVKAGTGLGDVFIQACGGLVWNDGTGVQRTEMTASTGYTAFAGIATNDVALV
jgi:pantoate kinase